MSGSAVYAGGEFSTIGGLARRNIAALDATSGAATSWNPNAHSVGSASYVFALAVKGPIVYAGGVFTSVGGQARNNLAALDADTGAATPAWNPSASGGSVSALAVSGSEVYAGGDFTSVGGRPQSYIAAIGDVTTPTQSPEEAQ